MDQGPQPTLHAPPPPRRGPRVLLNDDVAYILPMAAFLLFTWVGGQWPDTFPYTYVAKTLVTGLMLVGLWRHYTPVRWNGLWLGALVGAIVTVQWVGMETLLLRIWPDYPRATAEIYNPLREIASPGPRWAFIAVRWIGPTLVVPFMEELFWRDWLWRRLASPNDFRLVPVGHPDLKAFLLVALFFGAGVHLHMWATAIVCGLIYGLLLLRTRSLGACIVAHGVTNFLLGAYVLLSGDWKFW